MPGIVIVGAQWGDEGKGKITDLLAEHGDAVVRFQGGNNAGHTIVRGERGVEAAPDPLRDPLPGQALRDRQRRRDRPEGADRASSTRCARGASTSSGLRISANAHLIMPYHLLLDSAGEAKLGSLQIGTTRRGIGPCYADKAARLGIRVQDLLDEKILKKKIVAAMEPKRLSLRPFEKDPALDLHTMTEEYLTYGHRLEQHIADTAKLMWELLDDGKTVIFEGAQGAMLDIDHGTYPFVTSSNPLAGAACVGTRRRARRTIDEVWGISKAYTTRVGAGPVPERAARRDGRDDPQARRRVRHDHRAPAAHRLARPRRAALRGAPEHADRARRSPSSTCSPGSTASRCAPATAAPRAPSSTTSPTTRRCCTTPTAELTELRGWKRGPRRVPHALRPARRPRASTCEFIAEHVGAPVTLVGVGPGREQMIWTDAGRATLIADQRSASNGSSPD